MPHFLQDLFDLHLIFPPKLLFYLNNYANHNFEKSKQRKWTYRHDYSVNNNIITILRYWLSNSLKYMIKIYEWNVCVKIQNWHI